MVKLTFVGTGSGRTSLSRFHSSLLISASDTNLLIDAGDGISKALLSQSIEYNIIERIFITHLHSDHYTGLPSLITQMKMGERKNDLHIYAEAGLLNVLKRFMLNSYLFDDRLGFRINYEPVVQNIQYEISNDFKILSRQNSHLNSVIDFAENSTLNFSSSSLMISAENKNIYYTSDIDSALDLQLFDDYVVDLFISELTHIQPDDIVKLIRTKPKTKKVIFTHINKEMEKLEKNFTSFIPPEISTKFLFAYDGQKITL